MPKIVNAGAIFIGSYTPEPIGDYIAGPNHTLPTMGTAAFSSPLGVYDFVKRSSLLCYDKTGFDEVAQKVIAFANVEGLQAHGLAVKGGLMAMNSKWLRNSIRNFEPYTIPEIKEKTIINANESPYNVLDFPSVREDFFKGLQNLEIFRYPAPMADALRQALAEYVGCRPEQVLATNGGDEILALIIQTFINPGDTVLLHVPTFDVYISNAEIGGAKVVRFDEGPDFVHDAKAYCEEVKRLQPKLTVICNPNNPTGAIWSTEEIKAILDVAENLVVVDEAYIEFSGHESVVSLVDSYDNLIVVRTLSKAFGLAGCRLGYGVTNKGLIEALMLTKLYYNLNSFTQLMGLVVMKHRDEILDHNVPPTVKTGKLDRRVAKSSWRNGLSIGI